MRMSDYPITDGFVLSTKQRCSLTFRDIVVQEYELLRRSSAMRNKMWLAPKDSTVLIPAFDSFEYQIYMAPGSVIWGYAFVSNQDGNPRYLSFNVRDSCNDLAVFSEVSFAAPANNAAFPQMYLTKPLVVGAPGLLNVEICNNFSEALPAQVVLYGGEPAPMVGGA